MIELITAINELGVQSPSYPTKSDFINSPNIGYGGDNKLQTVSEGDLINITATNHTLKVLSEGDTGEISGSPVPVEVIGDTSLKFWGAVGDGVTDDTQAFTDSLVHGGVVTGEQGAVYSINSEVDVTLTKSVDLRLNGATLMNNSATDRMLIVTFPYEDEQTVSSVDLVNTTVTVSDGSAYSVGDRVKLVSGDRCNGNRPAEINGDDYWQSQSFTVNSVVSNVVSFRGSFETDFTFATSPKLMKYSKATFKFDGGMEVEAGFAGVRTNGLLRVRGGSNHILKTNIPRSNNTAIEFWGCDGARVTQSSISNVSEDGEVSGHHGASFVSCINAKVDNSAFHRCRHSATTNDYPKPYSEDAFFVMGPTYNYVQHDNFVTEDVSSGLSSHHGVRGGSIHNNAVYDSESGCGIRGWNIDVRGNHFERCDRSVFVYSEEDVASVDKTKITFVDGNTTRDIQNVDLQVQKAVSTTVGSNRWSGGGKRGWFFNVAGTVTLQGNNDFFSSGTFDLDDNFLHTVSTPVENKGVLTVDIDGMTINNKNDAIYSTSDDFINDGTIIVDAPSGIDRIHGHITSGDVFHNALVYSGKSGNPLNLGGTGEARVSLVSRDGSYSYAYQTRTAEAGITLTLNGSNHPQTTIVMTTDDGAYTLGSIDGGKWDGQRLLLRASGANTFTLNAGITNLDLNGPNLVMSSGDTLAFTWSGSTWIIESRTT